MHDNTMEEADYKSDFFARIPGRRGGSTAMAHHTKDRRPHRADHPSHAGGHG